LTGNCIIAAGMMSYGGPFDNSYRQNLLSSWKKSLEDVRLASTKDVSLINVVGNKILIETWKGLFQLPDDNLSIENAIVLH